MAIKHRIEVIFLNYESFTDIPVSINEVSWICKLETQEIASFGKFNLTSDIHHKNRISEKKVVNAMKNKYKEISVKQFRD